MIRSPVITVGAEDQTTSDKLHTQNMQTHPHKACGFVMARESGNGALDQFLFFLVSRFRFRVADSDTDKKVEQYSPRHIFVQVYIWTRALYWFLYRSFSSGKRDRMKKLHIVASHAFSIFVFGVHPALPESFVASYLYPITPEKSSWNWYLLVSFILWTSFRFNTILNIYFNKPGLPDNVST